MKDERQAKDEFWGVFGVAAYGGPACAVAKAWAEKNAPQIFLASLGGEPWPKEWDECKALLVRWALGEGVELPKTDEEGLRPLARMFGRRFLKDEVTLEVLLNRIQRIYQSLGEPEDLVEWNVLGKDIAALQHSTDAKDFSEDPLEALGKRARALVKTLLE